MSNYNKDNIWKVQYENGGESSKIIGAFISTA